jgi:hypothetical protein
VDYTRDVKSLGGGSAAGQQEPRRKHLVPKFAALFCLAVGAYALWNGFYICALILLGMALLDLFLLRRWGVSPEDNGQVIAAEYGVPHCKFQRTPEGFTVSFNQLPEWLQKLMAMSSGKESGLVGALMGLFICLPAMIFNANFGGTKIEVTPELVVIDGKKLNRKDFGGFLIKYTLKLHGKEETLAVLGFSYGARSFSFGGCWPEGIAAEVAAALNRHLRITPQAGNETSVSPEELRAARPSDF